jgi:hypothetical protein
MLMSPFAVDHANELIRERIQRAANDALADEAALAHAGRGSRAPAADVSRLVAAARGLVATSLRKLATRLDPSVDCEPCLAVPTPR